jgi:hypothetical protein
MNDMGDLPQAVADLTFTRVRGGRATVPRLLGGRPLTCRR